MTFFPGKIAKLVEFTLGKKEIPIFLVLNKATNFVVGYTGLDCCTLQPPGTCSKLYTLGRTAHH